MSSDLLGKFTGDAAVLLAEAGAADFANDTDSHMALLNRVAGGLFTLFTRAPNEVPYATAALSGMAPSVERAQLAAACEIASHAHNRASGDLNVLFDPNCLRWAKVACAEYDARLDYVLPALAVKLDPTGITRVGAPLWPWLREVVGRATVAEVDALMAVRQRHLTEYGAAIEREREFLALLGSEFAKGVLTMHEAVAELHGDDRVRAEELMATMPAVVMLPGGDSR